MVHVHAKCVLVGSDPPGALRGVVLGGGTTLTGRGRAGSPRSELRDRDSDGAAEAVAAAE